MANFYVDAQTGNDSTGSGTSGAPWKTTQKGWDSAAAGDTLFLRGTETLSGPVTFSSSKQRIRFIGCGTDWVAGAAQFVLDGANVAASIFAGDSVASAGQDNQYHFLTLKRSTTNACARGSVNYTFDQSLWNRCIFELHGGEVFEDNTLHLRYNRFHRCIFRNNSSHALTRPLHCTYTFCRFSGNAGHVLYRSQNGWSDVFAGCLMDDNGQVWASAWNNNTGNPWLFLNCAMDANAAGIVMYGDYSARAGGVLGCRMTNMGAGKTAITVSQSGRFAIVGHNYFSGNGADLNSARRIELEDSLYAQSEDGYEDQAGGDFNLASDALMRSIAVPLDWDV